MRKVSVFILMILAISAAVNLQGLRAESYQFEVGGYYFHEKADSTKENSFGLDATMYFEQVNVDGKPYAEAAFLEKAGYVTLGGNMGSFEYEEEGGEGDADPYSFGIDVGYVFPVVPVSMKAGYKYTDADGDFDDPTFSGDITSEDTINNFTGELGYYFSDGLLLAGTVAKEKWESTTKVRPEVIPDETLKWDTMSYGAFCKYVTMINADMGINLEASYVYVIVEQNGVDDLVNNVYQVKCDFYVTPMIGIGGMVEINTGDDKEEAGNTYTAEASVFFTPNVAIMGSYSFFAADEKGVEDINSFEVAVKGRI